METDMIPATHKSAEFGVKGSDISSVNLRPRLSETPPPAVNPDSSLLRLNDRPIAPTTLRTDLCNSPLLPQPKNRSSRLFNAFQSSLGVLLLVISAVFFSLSSLCVKLAFLEGLPMFEVVAWRSLQQMLYSWLSCRYYNKINPFGDYSSRRLLCLRGFLGAVALGMFYVSIYGGSFANVHSIFFTSPFFATIFAYVWLGETFHLMYLVLGLLTFIGVILVSRPTLLFGQQTSLTIYHGSYYMVALCGAIIGGAALCAIRKIGRTAKPMQMVFYFGLISSIIFVPIAVVSHTTDNFAYYMKSQTWFCLIGVGIPAFIAQIFLNTGLRMEKVGIGSFIRNLDIVFAFTFQVMILHQPADMMSIVGSCLIISASAITAVGKFCEGLRQSDRNISRSDNMEYLSIISHTNTDYNLLTTK